MINGSAAPKVFKILRKQIYTLEDKKKFHTQWKNSRVKKSDFCLQNNLSSSVFDKWCLKFALDKNSTPSKNGIATPQNELLKVKVELPSLIGSYIFFSNHFGFTSVITCNYSCTVKKFGLSENTPILEHQLQV